MLRNQSVQFQINDLGGDSRNCGISLDLDSKLR
jgi:hypothetical protein